MKKSISLLLILLIAVIACLYIFVPSKQEINFTETIQCKDDAASRILINGNLARWWPGTIENKNLLKYKDCEYKINKITLAAIQLTTFKNSDSITGFLQVVSTGKDSTGLSWTSSSDNEGNPITKINQFYHFQSLKKNIQSLLKDLKKFFDHEENVYCMKIIQEKVKDSSLISTKKSFAQYPSTNEIYEMIDALKNYIKTKGGEQTNPPMLNVHVPGQNIYEAMVAIPVKRDLPSEGNFQVKKMVLGNILKGEIKGGYYTVRNAEKEMENYANDYKKTSPAIPFQSLVTDRRSEPDTSKWITALYYPVFN